MQGERQPDRPVAVLTAVFPQAGAVGADIAGGALGLREGRHKEPDEPVFLIHQQPQRRVQRLVRVRRSAEGRPSLRQQVDALLSAERAAVRPVAAAVPSPVPGALRRREHPRREAAESLRPRLAEALEQRCEAPGRMAEEEAQPDALAVHGVEAVVPVSAAEQRQALRAEAPADAAIERGAGVGEQRSRLPGARRLIALALVRFQRRGDEKRHLGRAEVKIACALGVFAQRPGQPEQIVRAAAAQAPVALRMGVPPVHHVALGVLMAASVEDALAGKDGGERQQIDRVLQLVAEAVGPAALIEAAAREQAAAQGLIHGPMVYIITYRLIGHRNLQTRAEGIPVRARPRQRGAGLRRSAEGAQPLRIAAAAAQHALLLGGEGQQQRAGGEIRAQVGKLAAAGVKAQPRQRALGVLGREDAALRLRAEGGGVRPQGRADRPVQQQALRALQKQQQRAAVGKDRGLHAPPGELLFVFRPAVSEADAAGLAVIGGKEAQRPRVRLRPEGQGGLDAAQIADRLRKAHLPRVFPPERGGAALREDRAETVPPERELPVPRRERVAHGEAEGLRLLLKVRDGARPCRAQRGDGEGLRRALAPARGPDRPAFNIRRGGERREVHAAAHAQQRLQPQPGQLPPDLRVEGAAVFAQLTAQIDQLAQRAAASEQQEAPQQRQRLACVGAAAEQRQLAGDPVRPERPARRGGAERRVQCAQQGHRGAGLLPRHAEAQRRGADHIPALLPAQNAPRALQRLLRGRGGAEGEAQRLHLPGPGGKADLDAQKRRVEGKARLAVAGGAEPEPHLTPARQAAQQQRAIPRLALEAEHPVGRVGRPVPLVAQAQRKAQRRGGLGLRGAAQAQLPALPGRVRRGGEAENALVLPVPVFPDRLCLAEGPERGLPGGQESSAAALAKRQRWRVVYRRLAVSGFDRPAAADAQMPQPVREQAGGGRIGRAAAALPALALAAGRALRRAAALPAQDGPALRDALLQQQPVRAHGGVCQKAAADAAVAEGVGRGEDAHAHVVGHPAGDALALVPAAARGREVQRLIEAVRPARPEALEPAQVFDRCRGVDREREKARVGGRDHVPLGAPPQRQRLAAAGLVAVAQRGVERVKGALRDAPGLAREDLPPLGVEAEAGALGQEAAAR